jgi:anti-sigma28 factor (negative regulator of flagellin synthesis)
MRCGAAQVKISNQNPTSDHMRRDEREERRLARFRQLEAAVRNGTYRPNPELIAQKMLASPAFLQALERG